MSFVKTLAALTAGFAAAKGYDKYRKMGGWAGMQEAMAKNPALANMQTQMSEMMAKMGLPDNSDAFGKMMDEWQEQAAKMGENAAAGLAGLMTAMGGAAAAGTEQAAKMMDSMTGNTAASDAQEENAKLMIRAMIQAAKADGEIDEDERKRIMEHLGDMTKAERDFVKAEMEAPIDVNGLALDTGEHMKAQVYAMSLMAMRVDKTSEASYLDGLAAALGLSDNTRKAVHKSMGVS